MIQPSLTRLEGGGVWLIPAFKGRAKIKCRYAARNAAEGNISQENLFDDG
jgi:hypothetical protein